jgi:5-methylcytosine-specific restriction protein A
MSKYRTKRDAYKDDPNVFILIKAPSGRNLCRFCQTEVQPPRRNYCSKQCVHEWSIRSNTRYARACVRRRDKGICAICKTDCTALRRQLDALPLKERHKKAEELHIPKHRVNYKSLWDMDHIIPVAEDGGEAGLNNLRTLCCMVCHPKVTAELRTRLALQRKACKDNEDK